jgi:hypothetical protein
MIVSINNGKVFISGKHTTDAELIGYALLDYAETTDDDNLEIVLRDGDVFINDLRQSESINNQL